MKRSSWGMVLAAFLSFAVSGAAADRIRVADGLDMRVTSVSIAGDRLAWADPARQEIGLFSLSTGQPIKAIKVPGQIRDLQLTGRGVFFLGDDGRPSFLSPPNGKVRALDTVAADGIGADEDYIVWYNADRVIVHDLRQSKRSEFKADQMIRDASVSGDTLVYIDGLPEHRDQMVVVNLRNGQRRSYKLYNAGNLAVNYPYAAVLTEENNGEGKLRVLNLVSETELAAVSVRISGSFSSDQRDYDLTSEGIIFRNDMESGNPLQPEGIVLTEFDKNRTVMISRTGTHPVVAGHWAAWLESGQIWATRIGE